MRIYKYTIYVLTALLLVGCGSSGWQSSGSILLDEVTPIGMGFVGEEIWISDGDHNRMIVVDKEGNQLKTIDGIERPMHLDIDDDVVYVPSYGSDDILMIKEGGIDTLSVPLEFDAPAGVSINGDRIAIADFYNNQIAIYNEGQWKKVGKKGRGPMEFNYPTDVQIFEDKIYVADAYNNRIQVLTIDGQYIRTIGEDAGMNAATGIFIHGTEIYITDFEHDRVLIFDTNGTLDEIIEQGLNKPTDLVIHEDLLYITNYHGKYVSIFKR